MKSIIIWCLTAMAFCAVHAEEKLLFANGDKVAFIGDSLTLRGKVEPYGFINLIDKALRDEGVTLDITVSGGNGNQADHIAARMQKDVLDNKPQWLFVSCGVNDVQAMKSAADFEKDFISILDKAAEAGVKVIVITTTTVFDGTVKEKAERVSEYAEIMRKEAQKRQLTLVDANTAMQNKLNDYKDSPAGMVITPDGLHLSSIGNQILASEILKTIGFSPSKIYNVQILWSFLPDAMNVKIADKEFAEFNVALFELYCKAAKKRNISLADYLKPRIKNGLFATERIVMDSSLTGEMNMEAFNNLERSSLAGELARIEELIEIPYSTEAQPDRPNVIKFKNAKNEILCIIYGKKNNEDGGLIFFPLEKKGYEVVIPKREM